MAGVVHIVMRLLLLLSLITAGVNGEDGLIFAGQTYDVTAPCEENLVCFHIWQLSTSQRSDYVAVVSNGEIQTATPEDEDSKCTLHIKDLTAEDVGRHRCLQKPDVFSPQNTIPMLNLLPGKTVSLQCILLPYVVRGICHIRLPNGLTLDEVKLMWVDGAGTEVQQDSQHQIKQTSSCDITLTIIARGPETKKFRCRATVGGRIQTSMELRVGVPTRKGSGRGLVIEQEPENQGGNRDTIGATVGVVGCLVLTALVALFVVNRRRTRSQSPDESCHWYTTQDTSTNNDVMNADDVIYADVTLPVSPDREWVHESEPTVYACIRR